MLCFNSILFYLKTKPELVFVFTRHFALKQLLQEHPCYFNRALAKAMNYRFSGKCQANSTWFTVVPMLPCSSIWRILGSFDLIAESSFATWMTSLASLISMFASCQHYSCCSYLLDWFTFICMSSIATSIGVKMICFWWATFEKKWAASQNVDIL